MKRQGIHVWTFLLLTRILSYSYQGGLRYYTLEPIRAIADAFAVQDQELVFRLLQAFRERKEQETVFVRNAVRSRPIMSFIESDHRSPTRQLYQPLPWSEFSPGRRQRKLSGWPRCSGIGVYSTPALL